MPEPSFDVYGMKLITTHFVHKPNSKQFEKKLFTVGCAFKHGGNIDIFLHIIPSNGYLHIPRIGARFLNRP